MKNVLVAMMICLFSRSAFANHHEGMHGKSHQKYKAHKKHKAPARSASSRVTRGARASRRRRAARRSTRSPTSLSPPSPAATTRHVVGQRPCTACPRCWSRRTRGCSPAGCATSASPSTRAALGGFGATRARFCVLPVLAA